MVIQDRCHFLFNLGIGDVVVALGFLYRTHNKIDLRSIYQLASVSYSPFTTSDVNY